MMIKVGIFIVLVLLSANSILAQSNRSGQTPNSGQGNGVSPSTAIIFICLVSAFFLMGFISVYVRHCSERRNSFTDYDGTGSFRQSRGLDPAAVQAFPTFFYSDVKGHKLGQTALECAVCLLEFEDDEVLRLLPKCSHVFHPDCIGAWLAFHVTCPVCRANLVPAPGELNRVISLCRDADNDAIEPHAPTHNGTVDFMIDVESPEFVHTSKSPNQNVPRRSTPRRSRNTGKYPRSHSTGHSVVQPGESCERFTLRLPEGVRSQLVNSTGLRRSMSVVAFPRERSSRKGFRSNSVGTAGGKRYENYERFDQGARSGRWNFRLTPPFISRTGSTSGVGGEDLTATPRTLMRSIKSPLDRLFRGVDKDNVGERSTDRLRPEDFA